MLTLRQVDSKAAEEWYYPLNGNMTPDNISWESTNIAYFQCQSNSKHIFKRKICFTRNEKGEYINCPFCSGKLVLPEEDDFVTLHTAEAIMWDFNKNDKSFEKHVKNGIDIYWKCQNCNCKKHCKKENED